MITGSVFADRMPYQQRLMTSQQYLNAAKHYILLRDAMLAQYTLSSCTCPSDTSRHCTKMAKRRITQI